VKRDVREAQNYNCTADTIGVTEEAAVIVVWFGTRRKEGRKKGRKEGKMLTSLLLQGQI
jgi:hypothetical protein